MDRQQQGYHHHHAHHHQSVPPPPPPPPPPPVNVIPTVSGGMPYHSYLNYFNSSTPQAPVNGLFWGVGRSANTSNTSSPHSSQYHPRRPLYPLPFTKGLHPSQLNAAYLPYKQLYAGNPHQHYLQYHRDILAHYVNSTDREKLRELKDRLHSWKAISIAISFLALILLTCKLYVVDREINYLQFVSTEWLSPLALNRELLQTQSSSSSSSSLSSASQNGSGSLGAGSITFVSDAYHQQQPLALAQTQLRPQKSTNVNLYSQFNSSAILQLPVSQHAHALPLVISSSPSSSSSSSLSTGNSAPKTISSASNSLSSVTHSPITSLPLHHSSTHIIDPHLQNTIFLVDNLREDVDILIVELWSSRTTLVLSLVFVFVYIMSWCWMAYAIRETTSPHDVSLKTVLLLAIFAAVDIAASAGFVMVRVIMYVMRDYYFPRDMRTPILSAEFNQLAAYLALRLVTLKSSTGVVDIFVSVMVGFLTSLRVYSVICAVAFYRRVRKELLNVNNLEYILDKQRHAVAAATGQPPMVHMMNNLHNNGKPAKPEESSPNGFIPKIRLLNAHKDLEHHFTYPGGANNTGGTGESGSPFMDDGATTSSDEDPAVELKIQAADMPPHMQKSAMQSTVHALRTYTTEKHIAESVKQNFDQLYEPTWHCIVGRNWGSCVTHTKSNYIRMLYKDLTILLYKSS